MEAIDEYANENIVRSVAFTALEQRQRHNYAALVSISSQILRQRVHFLGPQKSKDDPAEWDDIVQWQQDNCPAMIESLWSSGGSVADEFYQKPVYYKRMDADTLHAIIEFAEKDTMHYVVILLLEEGNGDISDIKYNNTKELNQDEWLDVFANWSRSLEDAERIYLTKVTRHKKIFSTGAPDVSCLERKRVFCLSKRLWFRLLKRRNQPRIIGVNGHQMRRDLNRVVETITTRMAIIKIRTQATLKMSIMHAGAIILAQIQASTLLSQVMARVAHYRLKWTRSMISRTIHCLRFPVCLI
jgi:hypothetical protein